MTTERERHIKRKNLHRNQKPLRNTQMLPHKNVELTHFMKILKWDGDVKKGIYVCGLNINKL